MGEQLLKLRLIAAAARAELLLLLRRRLQRERKKRKEGNRVKWPLPVRTSNRELAKLNVRLKRGRRLPEQLENLGNSLIEPKPAGIAVVLAQRSKSLVKKLTLPRPDGPRI